MTNDDVFLPKIVSNQLPLLISRSFFPALRLCDVEEGRSWEDLGHPRQVPVVLNRPVNDHDEALLRAVTEGLADPIGWRMVWSESPTACPRRFSHCDESRWEL